MTAARRTQEERREATRAALLEAARTAFAEHGYRGAATDAIVESAGVTRGALYHHFDGKQGLFRAVFERLEAELVERIAADLAGTEDLWQAVETGLGTFLEACSEPDVVRIALLDAPTVLGWDEWRAIEAQYAMGLITATLEEARERGLIRDVPVAPLADVLLGALIQAGLSIAHASPRGRARHVAETRAALMAVLDGLRVPTT